MTIAGQNFEVYQGDNKEIIITVRNQDGSLTDLSGYNAVWCVHDITPENVVLLKSTGLAGGIAIPTPANGQLVITLTSDDTMDIITKVYGHQCEIEDSLGNHATVTTGYMKVFKSITHHLF